MKKIVLGTVRLSTAFITAALFSLALSSCQKVVSIDLNKASPNIVIEGLINNAGGPDSVAISMTGDYFTPSLNFPPVNGAVVIISDDTGNSDTLQGNGKGSYFSDAPVGVPGRTYSLRVLTDGKEYDAISTMPEEVRIDSFYAQPASGLFGRSGYNFYVKFKDPPQPGNYYRLIPYLNSLPSDSLEGGRGGIILTDDKLTNGNEITVRFGIRSGKNNQIGPGDTISVSLLSVDKATYDYYSTLRDILAADQSPTSLSPANPNTNLSNGALGYFSAYSVESKSLVLR